MSLLSLGGAWLAAVAIQALPVSNPATTLATQAAASSEITASPDAITQGGNFFAMSCSQCHADDATGDEGPNLHNLTISNARIAKTIKNGIKGEMPSFAKKYDDKRIAVLVSYLRSLR